MDLKKLIKDAALKQQNALKEAVQAQANTALNKIGLSLNNAPATPAPTSNAIGAPSNDGRDDAAFWQMARNAVGLPTTGKVRSTTPNGYPDIAPTNGTVSADLAGQFGNTWWRIYKLAEEADRDPAEIAKYKSTAYRWYTIRDKG